jgi:hypothetical protein
MSTIQSGISGLGQMVQPSKVQAAISALGVTDEQAVTIQATVDQAVADVQAQQAQQLNWAARVMVLVLAAPDGEAYVSNLEAAK